MGLFDFVRSITNKRYADSSSIPQEERQYYQPDDYYTLVAHPNTPFEKRVISFEERKRISYPSKTGLYVAEILLLYYCDQNKYPDPKNGYPSFWWFEFGIRDVGGKLRDLERRGYLVKNDSSSKYSLTEKGKDELDDNAYIPYVFKNKKCTLEGNKLGTEFNVWSVNKLIHDNPDIDPEVLIKEAEKKVTTDLDTGVDAEASGDEEKAIEFYKKQVAEGFDGSHPYDRLAIIYRKKKQYSEEVAVLEKAVKVFSCISDNRPDKHPKLQRYKERLKKAKELEKKQPGA